MQQIDLDIYPLIHSQITKNTYLTGWEGSLNKHLLKLNNIKTIICLNKEFHKTPEDLEMYSKLGITHYYIDLDDIPSANLEYYFDKINNIVDRHIDRGAILFHCTMGISRSVSALISVILKRSLQKHPHVNVDAILQYVKKKRGCSNPNAGFYHQLKKYEHRLRKQIQY